MANRPPLRTLLHRSLFLCPLGFALAASSFGQWAGAQPVKPELKRGFESIQIKDARNWLGYLAGPECEGRGTGQPGFQKAMEFVAGHFKKLGLKPLGDNGGYFQFAEFYRSRLKGETLRIQSDSAKFSGDQIGIESAQPGKLMGLPVLITIKQDPKDFQIGESVKDKIVIIKSDKPWPRFAFQLTRAGASAIISIVSSKEPSSWRVTRTKPAADTGMPRLQLTESETLSLLSSKDQEAVKASIAGTQNSIVPLQSKVLIRAEIEMEPVKVANVVAVLEGTDPTLKSEYIGVGGHLDHLGRRGNTVWPGADDDGSGSTAVLCVAKAMVANPLKPKRSVVFMTFFGEEMGLLGSAFLVKNPPVPLANMVAELQMDMVGRNSEGEQRPGQIDDPKQNIDTLRLVGSKRISTELDAIIQAQNTYLGFKFLYDAEDVYTRSDHYNFARNGIPIAFFFDGFHPDYHQPTDTVDKINFEKLTNTAKLVYLTIHDLASREKPPMKDVKVN